MAKEASKKERGLGNTLQELAERTSLQSVMIRTSALEWMTGKDGGKSSPWLELELLGSLAYFMMQLKKKF